MRIFVAGADGFVDSVAINELIDAGHSVLGLARSDASTTALHKVGAAVQRASRMTWTVFAAAHPTPTA